MEMIIGSSVFIYLIGLLSFCINRKHILLILLSLEFVVVSLFLGLYIYLRVFGWELYFLIIYLTVRVYEGALGLSILALLMRTYGNDYIESFNLLW